MKKKVLNKNYKIVETDLGLIVIPIIDIPKYFIEDLVLTEYDTRNIQKEVACGNLSKEEADSLNIKDNNGNIFKFNEDGSLINTPEGYGILSRMVLDIIAHSKK